jgi:hypothetical protein
MRRRSGLLLLLLVALFAWAQPLRAQNSQEMRIEEFVTRVARHWAGADVAALVDLIPTDGTILLDTGEGDASANSRHAAAALRALFSNSETLGARPIRITVTGMTPQTGFSELAWTYRSRGAPDEQVRSIYLAVAAQAGVWRITELRLMP